jgi:hypothetical protein
LQELGGFQECHSLCRIEIPSSVEIISWPGFCECASLRDIIFSFDSHLRELAEFQECTSLCRIEIPSSVEIIEQFALNRCPSLQQVTFATGSRIRIIKDSRDQGSSWSIRITITWNRIGADYISLLMAVDAILSISTVLFLSLKSIIQCEYNIIITQ